MRPTHNPTTAVIVEVRGGTVQSIRSNHPETLGVTLVDWDHIQGGDRPIEYGVEPLTNSDPALLLGVEGNEAQLADWFESHGTTMPDRS